MSNQTLVSSKFGLKEKKIDVMVNTIFSLFFFSS